MIVETQSSDRAKDKAAKLILAAFDGFSPSVIFWDESFKKNAPEKGYVLTQAWGDSVFDFRWKVDLSIGGSNAAEICLQALAKWLDALPSNTQAIGYIGEGLSDIHISPVRYESERSVAFTAVAHNSSVRLIYFDNAAEVVALI